MESLSYPRANRKTSTGRKKITQTYGPSLIDILKDVCEVFKQPIELIAKPGRKEERVCCKRIYCYVSCLVTDATMNEIGDLINKDHTTVMHHRHQVIKWKSNWDQRFFDDWLLFIEKSTVWKNYKDKQ